jgi:3-methyladenine DNA glycosylase/8-oxoguanine DNA glycosylase
MATSIIDYIFRELGDQLPRPHDLAHVSPEDLRHDTLGKAPRNSEALGWRGPIPACATASGRCVKSRMRSVDGIEWANGTARLDFPTVYSVAKTEDT